jgi:hypothetical protein
MIYIITDLLNHEYQITATLLTLEVLKTLNLLKSFKINKNLRQSAKSAPIKNRDKLGEILQR